MTGILADSNYTLEIDGISKYFGKFRALRDISFKLRKGEFLTMLGPSGSGKTTTLRAIAGFSPPDRGSIRLAGRDVATLPQSRRNIGMVFQDYALFPHMTVAQNVAFPLDARGVGKDAKRKAVQDIIDVVGLTGMEDRTSRQLSGGQQQRVALARALVSKPELVLLDEPLAALDKKLRGTMQLEILRIARQVGATVISVTHDQEEALVMSDRIALFSSGELAQIGTPQELYQSPANRFVADFVGEANVIPASVILKDDGTLCVAGGFTALVDKGVDISLSQDDSVDVVLRPEHLFIVPQGKKGTDQLNSLKATVQQVIYLGSDMKIEATTDGGATVQARLRDFEAVEKLSLGTAIEMSWKSSDAIVLKPSKDKPGVYDGYKRAL